MSGIVDLKSKNNDMDTPINTGESAKESYPWGLRVSLNNESIEKLRLDINKLKTGEPYKLNCEAIVTSISQNDYEGKISNEVSMQITGMTIPKKTSSDRLSSGQGILKKMRGSL